MVAERPGATRLPGAHCYEVFAGAAPFAALHDAEPGTFYLTDFLAKHFDALVWQGLGLDRHPELLATYFAHYRRVVLLSQRTTPTLARRRGRAATASGWSSSTASTGRTGSHPVVGGGRSAQQASP